MPFRPAEKYSHWWIEKVREGARSQLTPGETVKAGTYGQEVASYWMSVACFWKPRLVVVTDSNVLVFKSGILNSAKTGELIARLPLASSPLSRDGRALLIGEHRIIPPPGAGRETDEVVSAAVAGVQPAVPMTVPAQSTPPPRASVPPPA